MDPTPYNIADVLKDENLVLQKWQIIGYELGISEDVMSTLERRRNVEHEKMVLILKQMFEEAKNAEQLKDAVERVDYVESIKKALRKTSCGTALGWLEEKFKKVEEKKDPAPNNIVTPSLSCDDVDGEDVIDLIDAFDPLHIPLKPGANYGTVKEGSYMLTSEPRGYVLMVNNITFSDPADYRKGAEHDSTYMKTLFTGLKFRVDDFHENVPSKKDLDDIIEAFRKKCNDENAKSCIVIICSHGTKDVISSCNGEQSNIYNDVVYKFKNALEPSKDDNLALKDVPKIFIFNACRGGKRWEHDSVQEERRKGSISNTIVCYSTSPYYASNRDRYCGTWFMCALYKGIAEHACDKHFEAILIEVQDMEMRTMKNRANVTQVCTWSPFTFRNFYFNPEF